MHFQCCGAVPHSAIAKVQKSPLPPGRCAHSRIGPIQASEGYETQMSPSYSTLAVTSYSLHFLGPALLRRSLAHFSAEKWPCGMRKIGSILNEIRGVKRACSASRHVRKFNGRCRCQRLRIHASWRRISISADASTAGLRVERSFAKVGGDRLEFDTDMT